MSVNTIEDIKWDSDFFGYPVSRIVFDHNSSDISEYLLTQLKVYKNRLTYLFVPVSEERINKQISELGACLVDQKTSFIKNTEKHLDYSNRISEFPGTELNENLIRLVLQAGKFSRFNTDCNFTKNEYKRLYTEWLSKSLNKTIALKTYISSNKTKVVGITTLCKKNGKAEIGLVAVDENSRGRGIGTDLIHFAENDAHDLGFAKIKVVTQLKNLAACRLYEKCGFKVENIINIYHYWR